MSRAILVLFFAMAAARAACVAVATDRILAGDLARVAPAFAALAADTPLAYTPAPGSVRHFRPPELERIARAHRLAITSAAAGACFERQAAPLQRERVLEALRAALPDASVQLELLDFQRTPVPAGTLEFPRSGLLARDRGPAIWRGRLKYSTTRSVPVWARVRLSAPREAVIALEDLAPGKPVAATQVKLEKIDAHPFAPPAIASVGEVIGRVSRRRIARGEALRPGSLALADAVQRGDTVTVDVSSGAARLTFQARAESAGRAGDTVLVRNPANGRRFRARVVGQGAVAVDAAGGSWQ